MSRSNSKKAKAADRRNIKIAKAASLHSQNARSAWAKTGRKQLKLLNSDSKRQSAASKARSAKERHAANKLKAAGWNVYFPWQVCDRIAIKAGRCVLVEFKKPGQILRPGQQEAATSGIYSYEVVYY